MPPTYGPHRSIHLQGKLKLGSAAQTETKQNPPVLHGLFSVEKLEPKPIIRKDADERKNGWRELSRFKDL